MSRRKLLLSLILGLSGLVFWTAPAYAQTSDAISGGSKASDYQPPTDNPQNNVASGLQNTSTGLQPVPGQANFSQENLSGTNDLQVAGVNGKPNPNTTSTAANNPKPAGLNPIPYIVIGLLTLGAVIYVVKQPPGKPPKAAKTDPEPAAEVKPEPLPKAKKPKKKPAKKKTPTKKRKK